MKRLFLLLFLAALIFDLSAQINKYGVPMVRNYLTEVTQGSEQNWCITKDKLGNMYFGNQDRGVIRYNGKNWSAIQIKNNPRIYSLASDDKGIVYVGAAYEFGYIQPDKKGNPEYISLADRIDSIPEIRIIWSIGLNDNKVYFLGPKIIYIYDTQTDSLSTLQLLKFNLPEAYRLYKINNKLIIADINMGLFELKDTSITQLTGGDFFKKKPCTVLLPFDENRIIVSTFRDGLYLYDYKTGEVNSNFVDSKLNEKFKELWIYSAAFINEELFAIGVTSQEGIFIFNRNGELVQQLKKDYCDLEDDAIYAMYCDSSNSSELWVSTLGAISKIYFNIPITHFGEKQGIGVGINELCEFQENIYVSSDAGILKGYVDDNNILKFKEITGTSTQYFPLEMFKTGTGGFLLSGSLDGLIQIMKNDAVRRVEENCLNIPPKLEVINAKKILQSSTNPDILFLGLELGSIDILRYDRDHWYYIDRIKGASGNVNGLIQAGEGGLWFSTDDPASLNKVIFSSKDTTITKYGAEKGVPDTDISSIHLVNDDFYICTGKGIFRYNKDMDKFVTNNSLTGGFSEGMYSYNFFIDKDGDTWFTGIDKKYFEMLFRKKELGMQGYRSALALLPNVPALDFMEKSGRIYMTKSKQINVIDKSRLVPDSLKVSTLFTNIRVGSDSIVMSGTFHSDIDEKRRIPELSDAALSTPEYSFNLNNITFEWTTPYYIDEQQTTYSYRLDGFDKEWSGWDRIFYKEYTNLSFGHYAFRVKAKTSLETEMNEAVYTFVILKPWYLKAWMIIIYVISVILLIWGIIAAYTKRLKNENIRLEGIVAERTAVVVKQKEELESSIHYASRIQMALLPSESIIQKNLKNYFILFRPRDIVSGDFYWMTKKGERLYIVAADCTGHGVPGAFMSLLGMSFLDEIIDKETAPRADFILNHLRLHVTESLKQSGGDDEAKDGMDIALLVIDFNTQRIEFSGAYNPCFRVRKLADDEVKNYQEDSGEMPDGSMSNGKYLLETIYASKMPIGISSRMGEDFVFYDWTLERGISYYLFSDGYIDQFGGHHGRKFMKKNFKRLILDIQDYPMNKQKELLENNLKEWMGSSPQIDDILVMGIRTD
jgi:serine phosphatase RsbU (regulator of sigma subunit)